MTENNAFPDLSPDAPPPAAPPARPQRDPDDPLQHVTALTPGGAPPEIPLAALDQDALRVIHRIRDHGHQAYLVGGCVRDLLLGGKPKDYDVATSAHPEEVRAMFRNCRLIGRRFRLAHVYFRGGKVVETATFRANPNEELPAAETAGDILITRDNVFGTAEEDARRRDFTINGLFYDVILARVIDYVGGREDLTLRRIRTIGDPDVRFREDPVRILRAVRFAAKCNLSIEEQTWQMMRQHAGDIARCAPPRVLEEIFRLLRCGHARRCFELLRDCGALPVLLPPLAEFLDRAPPEEAQALFTSLGLLDEVVHAGPVPDDAVLLSSLLVHLSQAELMKQRAAQPAAVAAAGAEVAEGGEVEDEPDAGTLLPEPVPEDAPKVPWSSSASARSSEALLAELVRSARLPRRIAERARLVLYAQKILSGLRRRRGSPLQFVRQNYFSDALLVFELYARSSGHGVDQVDAWRARYEEVRAEQGLAPAGEAAAAGEPGAAPEGAEGEDGRGRRRRRRGGRGRGPDGELEGAAPQREPAPLATAGVAAGPAREAPRERELGRGPADMLPF